MRHAVQSFVPALLLLAGCASLPSAAGGDAPAAAPREGARRVVLLHANDFHGRHLDFEVAPGSATAQTGDPGRSLQSYPRPGRIGGLARMATVVETLRDRHGAGRTLLLHAGDTFSDDLLGNLTRGEAMIRIMNRMDFRFLALGNHDFDYGWARTRELQRLARFPMRAANVLDEATGRPVLGDPVQMIDADGVRVGLLALGYHNTPRTTSPDNVEGLRFTSGIEAARTLVPELRKEVDLLVVVSHQGTAVDELLARSVPGIDVIVGGHSHDLILPARRVGDTWLVQALSDATVLGETIVDLAPDGTVSVDARPHFLWADEVEPHAEISALVESLRAPHRARLEAAWIEASERIDRQYRSPSPFDQLVGEVLRAETGAPVALLPGVGYGVSLQPGPNPREDLFALVPHDSELVVATVKGAEVLAVLEQSARNQRPDDPLQGLGGLVQTSGLAWTVDLGRPAGRRVSDVRVGDRPLDPAASYRVATHAGMLKGLHGYTALGRATDVRRTGRKVNDVVEAALRARGTVPAPAPDPITFVPRPAGG